MTRFVFLACIAMIAPATAQQAAKATGPKVTFTLDFPQSSPEHYAISVEQDGHARYESRGKVDHDSEDEPYSAEFEVSAGTRQKIFELAKQAKYFTGKVDGGNAKLAFTGAKVLSYEDGEKSSIARYNYSNMEPVRQLTALFQGMGQTLEYGRRLAYYHRYQKLALDDELKRMETQAKNNELNELGGVTPVLREIVDDASVLNVVRARAQALISMGGRQ